MPFFVLLPDRGYSLLTLLSHGWLLFQLILSYLLCAPLTHPSFHDVPWCSILTQWNILLSSVIFFRLLSRSPLEYISPHICTYSTLLICTIHASHLSCLESLAPRPNLPLPLVHLVAPELVKLLIISTSLCPTLKDSLLIHLSAYLYKSMSYFEGLFALFPQQHICPSKFPQTSLVFFVPKKDGKKCMVQDYCYLNKHTVKNNYLLPLIAQLVDKLQGAKLFLNPFM